MYPGRMKLKLYISGLIAILCVSLGAQAETTEMSRWAKHNPEETASLNHDAMSSILRFLTVEQGEVDAIAYSRAQGKAMDYIHEYSQYLQKIPVSLLNKDEQLAYWLNLHNVTVIGLLAENKKVLRKVKKHRGVPGKPGKAWSEKVVVVENIPLSLEEIEQDILIAQWQDPLVLYGLFYGTQGAGFTGLKGFSGPSVNNQLAKLAGKFINQSNNVKVKRNKVQVSSLYVWNKAALFGNDDQKLIAHLQTYAKGKIAEKLQNVNEVRSKHKYVWTSNNYRAPRQVSSAGRSSGGYGGGYGSGS